MRRQRHGRGIASAPDRDANGPTTRADADAYGDADTDARTDPDFDTRAAADADSDARRPQL